MGPFNRKSLTLVIIGFIVTAIGICMAIPPTPARGDATEGTSEAVTSQEVDPPPSPPKVAKNPPPAPDDRLYRRVVAIAASGKFDIKIVKEIQKLPRNDQPRLAEELAESSNSAMRAQAFLILKNLPPKLAKAGMQKLYHDSDSETALRAAGYLADRAKDSSAKEFLRKSALGPDPAKAALAVQQLGFLGGPVAEEVLLKVLQDKGTPKVVLAAAVTAAGHAKCKPCTPLLVALLDDKTQRKMHPKDDVRICDLAAVALAMTHEIHLVRAISDYCVGPLEKRDSAIAELRSWFKQHRAHPDSDLRTVYTIQLLNEKLSLLQKTTDEEERKEAREKIRATLKTAFCLGYLPGVDAIVVPCVRDQWRIMQAYGERWWSKYTGRWQELDIRTEREFLKGTPLPAAPDEQAAAFIAFADTTHMRKVWVWSMCRNFGDVFPKSGLNSRVAEIQKRLESGFRKGRKQIVLHGHIAVLEPLPKPASSPKPGALVQVGYGALFQMLCDNPSDWVIYQATVENFRKYENARVARGEPESKRWPMDRRIFDREWKLFPGNEWPFLGNAVYQLRVVKKPTGALDWADRALILNPGNAKAYAIRGMIRVIAGNEPDKAFADLIRAYELDPKSLGGEPETHTAIAFLIEKTLATKDTARAREYLKTLRGLRTFGGEQSFESTKAHAKLARAIGAASRR